jgi:hypothetical protein
MRAFGMLRTIGLDDQPAFETDEIDDVFPIGACRRNFRWDNRRPHNNRQSLASASVDSARIERAKPRWSCFTTLKKG